MKKMNILLLSTLMAAFLVMGCCEQPFENVDNTSYTATEEFSYEMPVDGQHQMRMTAINGPIDLVGIAGTTSVRVWGC